MAPGLPERTATKHMQEIFDAPEWFEALTLVERAALLGSADGDSPVDGDPPAEGNPPEAARRERLGQPAPSIRADGLGVLQGEGELELPFHVGRCAARVAHDR